MEDIYTVLPFAARGHLKMVRSIMEITRVFGHVNGVTWDVGSISIEGDVECWPAS